MPTIPPLKAVVAFEASMRHSSFSLAADELGVTAGAVGQQVQKLEQWLGVPLFVRQTRQVTPTPEARIYMAQVQPALAEIVHASRRMRERRHNAVRLSMPPSFAAKWFAPRMAHFLQHHPGISLSLSTSTALVDFELEGIDLAVRHFSGEDPRLAVRLLRADEARAYCSPAYARKAKLGAPDALLSATLLHNSLHPHWAAWLARYSGLTARRIGSIAGIQFDQSLMAIDAAVRAQGVVLTSAILVEEEVASKLLVDPFGVGLPLPSGYYLVHPRAASLNDGARQLSQWLCAQFSVSCLQPSGADPADRGC
ncbi:LysR substrate-binding domain-containing protein [Cupriavidus plantarum]|uniref:LysR substrate-binding domain-containing protein n=1 Tax=Cupriavidus plantarum TaxID=942865 RepID=UPI000E26F393|nr:LysR substrate-binding domain-containing protein [Cupriavidus plantarum]REE91149.1 LysR family transcriptional regulator [Cupriavidus plantarum]